MSKRWNAIFLQIWWRNKLIYILDDLRMSKFQQIFIFGWTVSLKKWFHILNTILFILFMTEALYKAGGVSLLIWRGVTGASGLKTHIKLNLVCSCQGGGSKIMARYRPTKIKNPTKNTFCIIKHRVSSHCHCPQSKHSLAPISSSIMETTCLFARAMLSNALWVCMWKRAVRHCPPFLL